MSIFSRIFRKREKQKNPDGSKTVIVEIDLVMLER